MPSTGEKPGISVYICDNCGQKVTLDNHDDKLPPYPKCNGTEFH